MEASDALTANPHTTDADRFTILSDALADGLVFIMHLSSIMGLAKVLPDVWDEVYRSNRSKGDGTRLFQEDGKMIKGDKYFRPNIKQFFSGRVKIHLAGPNWCLQKLVPCFLQLAGPLGATIAGMGELPKKVRPHDPSDVGEYTMVVDSSYPWMYAAFRPEVGRHDVGSESVDVSIILDRDISISSKEPVRMYYTVIDKLWTDGVSWEGYCQRPANVLQLSGLLGAIELQQRINNAKQD